MWNEERAERKGGQEILVGQKSPGLVEMALIEIVKTVPATWYSKLWYGVW